MIIFYPNKGEKIETIADLKKAALQRKSVFVPHPKGHIWQNPKPAAFIISMPAFLVGNLIQIGLHIYEPLKGE